LQMRMLRANQRRGDSASELLRAIEAMRWME